MATDYSARVLSAYLLMGGADWWNPDGATPGGVGGTCVAAYQAKGAASYAASKVNIANPGTYDLTEGVAPSWAAGAGWTFDGATTNLRTSLVHNDAGQTWSALVQFTGVPLVAGYRYLFSDDGGVNSGFAIAPVRGGLTIGIMNSGALAAGASIAAGNLAIGGAVGYIDGVPAGAIPAGIQFNNEIYIGSNFGGAANFLSGTMVAIAFYTVTLTAPQVLARATAMAAL